MQLLVNLTISVYFLQMPLTLLLLFEWDVGANVFSWLFAAADRKYIACVCGAIRRHVIEALTVHVLSILNSVEFEPKCIPCDRSPENISKRLRRLLVMQGIIANVHEERRYEVYRQYGGTRYILVERWYEAMLRLQSLASKFYHGISVAFIATVCLENMDPFHLSLADPMVHNIFVEAGDFEEAEGRDLAARIQCNIPHHRFAELVLTRCMGCLLDFTLREVIEACLILAGRSITVSTSLLSSDRFCY